MVITREEIYKKQLQAEKIPEESYSSLIEGAIKLIKWLENKIIQKSPYILGINGAQGAGKSTLSRLLKSMMWHEKNRTAVIISIDDLYLTKSERKKLAEKVHPLLKTRGVPGTHNVQLGIDTLNALSNAAEDALTPIVRFDKAIDDRYHESKWENCKGQPDLIIFEGWCVATQDQSDTELEAPINDLEKEEDKDGSWRRLVNNALKNNYRELFAMLDALIFLRVPDFEQVRQWRTLQEEKLAAERPGAKTMSSEEIKRFIQFYERLTRQNLKTMPLSADIVIDIDKKHMYEKVHIKR